MLPGPDIYYECPDCKTKVYVLSLLSGNTFGADFFSDGRCYAPMLPEYPLLTKCTYCGKIYCFEHQKPIGEFEIGQPRPPEFLSVPQAEQPDLSVYMEVIADSLFTSGDEEIFIRKKLLWEINDFIRWGQEQKLNEDIIEYNIQNRHRLIKLLENKTSIDLILLKAELHRNLGEFEMCNNILESIEDEFHQDVVEQIRKECLAKNRGVFLFESD
ncbi:MAG: hypothetical protein SCALA702_04560 [Melioribacteraceae bacterium]|nr:MAG: hypothetical protein SCALA702_04560 [Melioribacteraceae bacterium]